MKKQVCLSFAGLFFIFASAIASVMAAGNDPSEKGVATSPLKIHSFGATLGAMYAVNEEFSKECGDAFFGASLNHAWRFMDNASLFADMNWFYGEEGAKNGGGELGVDYFFLTSQFSPFAGAGVGGHYFYRESSMKKDTVSAEFSHKFGASVVAHAGFLLGITETASLRVRVPYRLLIVKGGADHGVGVEVGVMFSHRFAKIQKLDY